MQNVAGSNAIAKLIIASPFLLLAYPLALVMTGTSEVPIVLDRYSRSLAAFILFTALLYIVFAIALLRQSGPILALSLLALVAVTFALAASNTVVDDPLGLMILAIARLAAAIALAVVAMSGVRSGRAGWSLAALSAAALLFVPSTLDAAFLIWQTGTQGRVLLPENTYRPAYDLSKLSDRDIVLVGDSFVWGLNLDISQRVGDVLQAKLRQHDAQVSVYSLGVVGWGLKEYVKAVREIPSTTRVKRVIISFYQNDIPSRETAEAWLEPLSEDLGRSSISARLLLDLTRVSFAPSVEGYMEHVLGDFDESGANFARRWKTLVDAFTELFALASQRSLERPVVVIVPMLSTTDRERWLSAHQRVAAVAKTAGFDVLDLYDTFKAGTPQALHYRMAANDPHLGIEGNKLFADRLLQALDGTAPARRGP